MRQFVGRLAILDGRVVRHVDRLGDRARNERLGGSHHRDVAVNRKEPLALASARIRAVEDMVVLLRQMRRAFQRHGTADVVVRGLDVRPSEAKAAEKVEFRIVQLLGRNPEGRGAKLLAERPLVEHEANVERGRQGFLDPGDLGLAEPVSNQRCMADSRGVRERSVADGVGNDVLDLGGRVSKCRQRRRHRAVYDLEVTAPGELLELHQGEVRLDPCRIAIHHEANGAGRRDDRRLSIPVSVLHAQVERIVPHPCGQFDQSAVRAVLVVERHGRHVHLLVS